MKILKIFAFTSLLSVSLFSAEFISYDEFSKKLKDEAKKSGMMATTEEVKDALKAKDWAVVDVRTMEEWAGAAIKGSFRVGREAPEKALENIVLDDDDNFVKDKLVVVCNTASRAAIEAQAFKQMGFTTVKIYEINKWIDECNPVVTKYTSGDYKGGTKTKFGNYYAEHCKK
ncbi:rhodanese-like domain-containing protein [Arcobacter porcinus]|uniref:Molybdopterin biosynthesis protein MoeB n=1 Tax=Arcobacter porcinus TaxID=1935204 RepID=A0A1C0AYL5_9BACT|nr:rhodanese-like domain-containing protein [Arcobacter porcinus]OCL94360.1 molybdopterin biosynthesis protein MoeB [Aliarcobacter thereius]OCL83522.1 molybdopterin biosynthesis protein MoeB [Arcobacter porcinus]OCL83741.1 molybdopterin biosynthesis protein MoeB [Arcobacter porcinus]OCL87980.1 molybdopterin biosynthesis protein MoeB [Arcobacter porcinus]OCL92735.1 molybdopterin biosynthesis protein MoeB [Arcobacter porcinus]